MEQLIIIIQVLVSVVIVALVLVQHGKGAEVGASFGGGSSNTMFGSQGAMPFLMKVTTVLAIIFFASNLFLARMFYQDTKKPMVLTVPNTGVVQTTTPNSSKVVEKKGK